MSRKKAATNAEPLETTRLGHEQSGDSPSIDQDLLSAAFLAKSLSDTNRLRVLLCISNGKKSVSAIVEELDLSQPLVSHHLKELKRSLLVSVERNGPFIFYELSDARILDVIQTLCTVATDLLSARKTF
jgi:DNA-binding transcriptional ArsR family regulator